MLIDVNTTIIPNWFDREELNTLVGENVPAYEYAAFKKFIDDSDMPNTVSEMVRTAYCDWKARQRRNI